MIWQAIVAVLIGVAIWRVSIGAIRMLSTSPPGADPSAVEPTRTDFRCSVCGTEVTMTLRNPYDDAPPKHCHEEMTLVWRPGN